MIKRHWKKLTALFGLLVAIAGGLVAHSIYSQADAAVQSSTSSGSLVDILQPEALNGENSGAVNILVAGNSSDDTGHSGAQLTDSIMVAHIDITTKKLTLISVPRDMWVSYNGSYMKINAVYTLDGMDALQSTVEGMLGLTINHRVLVNYTAFREMIDAVGGIDITIESSDSRGIYDPMIGFSIGNGEQHLDGAQALLLARSRNDPTYDGRIAYGLPNGDFDRTMYQRKIAEALITKVASSETLTNTTKLKALFASISGNVESNLSVGQLRRLYDLSKQLSSTESVSIRGDEGNLLLANYTSSDGQSALIPSAGVENYTAIQAYIATKITPAAE